MWKFKLRMTNTLLTRAVASTLVLVLCTAIVVGGIIVLAVRTVLDQQMTMKAASIAAFEGARAEYPMLLGDRAELGRLADEVLRIEGVTYVELSDREGLRVERTGPRAGSELEAVHHVARPDSHDLPGMPAAGAGKTRSIGLIRVRISMDAFKASVVRIRRIAGLATACCLVLIVWLQSKHLRRLLEPLNSLSKFVAGVDEGKMDQRAVVRGSDEIAQVAQAFNRMLERLSATLVSKQIAEEANVAKSRFLANTGHELRTPLNAIIGYSELLEEECHDRGLDAVIPDLIRIRNAGRLLLDMMNDILDYSKLEAGRGGVSLEYVAIAPVLEEVAATVQPMARANGNTLIVEACERDLMVFADHRRFRQSLLNLASNACKFTEQGQVTLRATAAGDRCEIQVVDSGIGISAESLPKLFEAFVQVDSSQTRKYGGTGLGLAISRKFCRMMDGDITATSVVGSGSVFCITLPARGPFEAHAPTDPVDAKSDEALAGTRESSA